MYLKGKKVLVVGLGKTGEELCRFLLNRGARVKVSEKKKHEELGQKVHFWAKNGVSMETGGHELKSFLESDLIVLSPGVPTIPELYKAKAHGIKIISEIELAYRFLKGKIVGVTGSNGKSTTATLIHKILKNGGLEAYLAGNIGIPLISLVENSKKNHIFVTELSSFQLKHTEQFKVSVSVLLNISPDHLDWHKTFKDYFEAKKKIIISQEKEQIAILNKDDPLIWGLKKQSVYGFSRKNKITPGCFIQKNWIVLSNKKEEKLMKLSEIPLLGTHNQENIMAAALVGYIFSIPLLKIKNSIKNFKGLEHRLEKVLTKQGVDFYNDSKATNVDATLKSIQSFKKKIILILGGRDKGEDFRRLRKTVENQVKRIILIGESRKKIEKALINTAPIDTVSSLKEAVRVGYSSAEPGEVVLLAPACTSFDMFQNFEERGEIFKKEVYTLTKLKGQSTE